LRERLRKRRFLIILRPHRQCNKNRRDSLRLAKAYCFLGDCAGDAGAGFCCDGAGELCVVAGCVAAGAAGLLAGAAGLLAGFDEL
jgi:hypothetical protein